MTLIAHLRDRRSKRTERLTSGPLLAVKDICVRFGGIKALDGISFQVDAGTTCGIIGPNGAGKTTLFNCLSGLYTPSSGEITFNGQPLANAPAHSMAGLGLGRTFQNVALFKTMTVRRNILVGSHCRTQGGFWREALQLPSVRAAEKEQAAIAEELIEFLNLGAVADEVVSSLPFATLKRVELARALASQPEMLLLDEPAAGLNHESVEDLMLLIKKISTELNTTILLVEHHMNMVMRTSDQVVALNFGRKIADGTPEQVRANPEVISAYLGTTA